MTASFESIHNHHTDGVFAGVLELAPRYPALAADPDLLADVACVALNNLPPRYIRHAIDLSFYMTEKEREKSEVAVRTAVEHAFEFVQARMNRRARA